MLSNLEKTMILSVILNGLLFAVFHLDLQQGLYTFLMGILFATLVIRTNSIFSSIIAHITINGICLFFEILSYQTAINSSALNTNLDVNSATTINVPNWACYLIIVIFVYFGILLIKKLKKTGDN